MADHLILPGVEAALATLDPDDLDAGAVALARRYAALLDDAAVAAKYREHLTVLERVVSRYCFEDKNPSNQAKAEKARDALTTALGEHSVASDLGPKLLAVLQQLGLTPAARREAMKGASQSGQESTVPAHPLAEERAEAQRLRLVNGRDGA